MTYMTYMTYDELVDEYIRLRQIARELPPPGKPPWARPGQSWTTTEMRETVARMEEIVQEVGLMAQREFYHEVELRQNDSICIACGGDLLFDVEQDELEVESSPCVCG